MTVDALKRSLLAAKSVVYADPAKGGASGVYFARVLDRLEIAEQLKSRTILVLGARAAEVVARGVARELVDMPVGELRATLPTAAAYVHFAILNVASTAGRSPAI